MIAVAAVIGATLAPTSAGVGGTGAAVAAASRRSGTIVYTLPGDEVFAEGVAVDGNTYYVTGAGTGIIYRGDLDEPEAAEFIVTDTTGTGGIKVVGDRLVVARFFGVSVYDLQSGERLGTWQGPRSDTGTETHTNDVAIAPNGDAYISDSDRPVLYRIPAAEVQNPSAPLQELPEFLTWSDPPFSDYELGFIDANGLVVTPDGKFVLVAHFTDGLLFRVRVADRQVRQVDLGGYSILSGDGMVITDDNVLYVVRPARSLVAKIRLNHQFTRGRLLSETRDESFHGPTTAAIAGDRLLVVNSQFAGPPSSPPWTVSSIPLP